MEVGGWCEKQQFLSMRCMIARTHIRARSAFVRGVRWGRIQWRWRPHAQSSASSCVIRKSKRKETIVTRDSHVVTDRSTNLAQSCLTSEF